MLERILEPEVMESPAEAREYDALDHAAVNSAFCDGLLAQAPDLRLTLDVGTGTALIPIELCSRRREARVLGVDLAESMLELGRRNIELAGLSGAIALERVDGKTLPFAPESWSTIVSNSLIHHLAKPAQALAEMTRVLAGGGILYVRDLIRPESETELEGLVSRHASRETPVQRKLFRDSLRAALTVSEVCALVLSLNIDPASVTQTSDRHWTLSFRKPVNN